MRGGGIASRYLIMGDDKYVSANQSAKQLCETFPEVVELRPSHDRGVRLVRPDGYIAYSKHDGDSSAALGSMRSLLERQTNIAQHAS